MPKLGSLSIRRQLVILILLITLLPLGLIVYTAYNQRKEALETAAESVEHLVNEVATDQRVLLSGAEQLLSALAHIPAVDARDAAAVNTLLRELVAKNPQITNLLLIDPAGAVWASALPTSTAINAADRRFHKNAIATGRFSSGEYTIGKVLQKPALSFGYPIKGRFGKVKQVATAAFTLKKYDQLLKLKAIPPKTSLLITDHRGTILFCSPFPQFIGKQDRDDLFARMKKGAEAGRFSTSGIAGIPRIFAYKKVSLPGEATPYMYIRAGVPLETLYADVDRSLLVNVSSMLLMLLAVVGISSFICKRGILDKIAALDLAARKVAEGDLSVQVSEHVTGGELGKLGTAFDHMVARLRKSVHERAEVTRQLKESLLLAQRFSNALDHVPCYIYMKDDRHRYTYANQLTLELFGCAAEDLLGRDDGILIREESVKRVQDIDARALRGEQTEEEVEVVHFDGSRKVYLDIKTPLYDESGERVVGLLGVSTDITERKKSEELLAKSEERLRAIFDASQAGFLVAEPSRGITFANQRMADMFGCSMEELIGSQYLDHVHQSDKAIGNSVWRRLVAGEIDAVATERHFVKKDGSAFWGYLSSRRIDNPDGTINSLLGFIADITDRKEAETLLKQSEDKFAVIFNSSPDSITINRLEDAVMIEINRGFTQMLGYAREDVIGLPHAATGIWVEPEDALRIARQLRETGSVSNLEAKLRRKDGAVITALVSSSLIEIDNVPCSLNIARDITERDIVLGELHKMQRLESLGVLAGGIAHDFNNILTGIMGNISLAKMTLEESQKAFPLLANAEKASKRAADLAKQLLAFAKGGQPIKKTVCLPQIVEEAVSLALTGTNIMGIVELPPDLPSVEADEGQLNQAFHNIIINAAHSMPGGGTLTIRGRKAALPAGNRHGLPRGEYVELSFSDEGCGIADAEQKKIFDPYFTTKPGGSGLGLASTYRIVNNHAGHVTVTSRLGKGTTFTIYLPSLDSAHKAPADDSVHPPAGSGHGSVLVMDDEALLRDLAADMLTYLGYSVTTCVNGEEAVSLYREALDNSRPFSAVVMDLTIVGGMGGEEAAQRVLAMDPQARLIVSSGYSDSPAIADFRSFGFKAAIGKPYVAQELGKILAAITAEP